MKDTHLTIVSPNVIYNNNNITNIVQICKELDIKTTTISNIAELYPKISDPSFFTNVICINIEELYKKGDIDAWNQINALTTIINATVCRPDKTKKPIRRAVCIVAGANEKTDPKIIKDFLRINDMCRGIFPKGETFSQEDKRTAINAFMNGEKHIPRSIQKSLRNHVTKEVSSISKLTPRQSQVFDLIIKRGASNKSIARTLNISESTVKLHVTGVLQKYGVRNRTQLAVFSKK
jgi:DNA-binding CsgD family transcriptional regulator